jgi:hypothetical protein
LRRLTVGGFASSPFCFAISGLTERIVVVSVRFVSERRRLSRCQALIVRRADNMHFRGGVFARFRHLMLTICEVRPKLLWRIATGKFSRGHRARCGGTVGVVGVFRILSSSHSVQHLKERRAKPKVMLEALVSGRVYPVPTINREDGGDNDPTRKPGLGSLPSLRGPVYRPLFPRPARATLHNKVQFLELLAPRGSDRHRVDFQPVHSYKTEAWI